MTTARFIVVDDAYDNAMHIIQLLDDAARRATQKVDTLVLSPHNAIDSQSFGHLTVSRRWASSFDQIEEAVNQFLQGTPTTSSSARVALFLDYDLAYGGMTIQSSEDFSRSSGPSNFWLGTLSRHPGSFVRAVTAAQSSIFTELSKAAGKAISCGSLQPRGAATSPLVIQQWLEAREQLVTWLKPGWGWGRLFSNSTPQPESGVAFSTARLNWFGVDNLEMPHTFDETKLDARAFCANSTSFVRDMLGSVPPFMEFLDNCQSAAELRAMHDHMKGFVGYESAFHNSQNGQRSMSLFGGLLLMMRGVLDHTTQLPDVVVEMGGRIVEHGDDRFLPAVLSWLESVKGRIVPIHKNSRTAGKHWFDFARCLSEQEIPQFTISASANRNTPYIRINGTVSVDQSEGGDSAALIEAALPEGGQSVRFGTTARALNGLLRASAVTTNHKGPVHHPCVTPRLEHGVVWLYWTDGICS